MGGIVNVSVARSAIEKDSVNILDELTGIMLSSYATNRKIIKAAETWLSRVSGLLRAAQ